MHAPQRPAPSLYKKINKVLHHNVFVYFFVFLAISVFAQEEPMFYSIQLATFSSKKDAEQTYAKTLSENDGTLSLPYFRIENIDTFFTVRIGKFASKEEGLPLLEKIRLTFPDSIIIKVKASTSNIIRLHEETSAKDIVNSENQEPPPSPPLQTIQAEQMIQPGESEQKTAPAVPFSLTDLSVEPSQAAEEEQNQALPTAISEPPPTVRETPSPETVAPEIREDETSLPEHETMLSPLESNPVLPPSPITEKEGFTLPLVYSLSIFIMSLLLLTLTYKTYRKDIDEIVRSIRGEAASEGKDSNET